MGSLTNEVGVSFGSTPKVLRVTKHMGPGADASGHRGSKRAKNCSTSEPFFAMCAIWDWAKGLIFCRFWTKKIFKSVSGVGQLRGGALWPLEVRSLIFGHFLRMKISLWSKGPSKRLKCHNFDFDPIFRMPP